MGTMAKTNNVKSSQGEVVSIDFVFEEGIWKIKYKNKQLTYPCLLISEKD